MLRRIQRRGLFRSFGTSSNLGGRRRRAVLEREFEVWSSEFKLRAVSLKKERIAEVIKRFEGLDRDPHYLGFFEYFNKGEFYEAHDVLESLWLAQRKEGNGAFYK